MLFSASDFATGVGSIAGSIAIFGFLAHALPVLRGASDRKIQAATVIGGLVGFGFSSGVVVLSALLDKVFS
jgi:hypothetical protein